MRAEKRLMRKGRTCVARHVAVGGNWGVREKKKGKGRKLPD